MKTYLAATAMGVALIAMATSQILPKHSDVSLPYPYKLAMSQ